MTGLAKETIEVPNLPGRIPSLDGLRAISIALVFLGHGSMSYGSPSYLSPFHHLGNFGVRFFFVISGFLITTLLLKEWKKTGRISLRKFYMRRALRIFPAAFAFIGIIAILSALGVVQLKSGDLLHALTYTMNYKQVRSMFLDHLWSLSVEEQFYLLWPGLLILLGARKGFRGALIVCIAVPILRAFMWWYVGASETAMTKHFESVADALATGCLLAGFFNRIGSLSFYSRLQRSGGLFLSLAACLVFLGNGMYLIRPGYFYVFGQTIANIGTVLCIDWCIRNSESMPGRLLNSAPLAFIGTLSYSLYLYQNPFFLADVDHWATTLPLNIVCAIGAALASYYLVESPFLKLKRFYEPAQKLSSGDAQYATASGSTHEVLCTPIPTTPPSSPHSS